MKAGGGVARLLRRIACAALLAAPASALATLRECRPPEDAEFVVFLSEPEFTKAAFATRPDMLRFFNRLQEYLDQRRDRQMAGLRDVPFRVARCEGRVPAIDGSEFTAEMVRSLYGRKVVLELWGALDVATSAGRRVPRAQMNYLLVPVKRGAAPGSGAAPGLHRFNYPDAEIVATDFVELVSNGDLHAFVAAAIGVMAFDGEDYARAHELLCSASPMLSRIERRLAAGPETAAQSQGIARLRAFVVELAGKAVAEAARKPGPKPLFASLQDPKDPCSAGETSR